MRRIDSNGVANQNAGILLKREVKGWFLTYPQCPLTPSEALQALVDLNLSSIIVEYLVASEKHKDGGLHIHAFIKYEKKIAFVGNRWNLIWGDKVYHGQYLPAKSWTAVQKYCKKGDDYISNIDVLAAIGKKAARNKECLEMDPIELAQQGKISVFQIKALYETQALVASKTLKTLPRCVDLIPNTFGLILLIKDLKQKHFWFWSKRPNTGKTTFLQTLASQYPCHFYNYSENYQTIHSSTQFVFMDEFSEPHIKLTFLNQMADGTWSYPVKGGQAVTLLKPILIVCSNKPPEEVYIKGEFSIDLINARFSVFEL